MSAGEISSTNDRGEAAFVFPSIAMKRGGVTRTVLARARLFSEAGIKVRLLLIGHGVREDVEAARIRKAWSLPDSIEIRYFWREAAPDGGGAERETAAAGEHEPDVTAFTETTSTGTIIREYRDGLLIRTKRCDSTGRLQYVENHDPARRVLSREAFDPHGRLVRIDEMDPHSGKPTLRRWFDRSGRCWLTTWLDAMGWPTKAVRHLPEPVAYDNIGACIAEWVDDVLAETAAPVVFCDKRYLDNVLLAMKHPGARKVAVLHNPHTSEPYGPDDPPKKTWLPLLSNLDSFDAVVALTHRQRDDIVRRFGGAGTVTVISHPTHAVPKLRVPREPGLLVVVARLDRQKRLEDAIEAFARAATKVPEARFDIYGSGAQERPLRKLVAQLGIADRVRFRGFTSRPLEAFAGASATVLSSRFEGLPLVLCEAMGVGTPFVAYDISYGPDEVIRNDVDGLLVPAADVDALAEAMVRVLGDAGYAAKLGERAREVGERFSEQRWASEWTGLHHELANRP